MEFLEKIDGSTWRIKVLVQPRAKTNEIVGKHAGRIKIKIQAPPVNGKANEFLCSFLSDVLGVRKNQLTIEKGSGARHKSIIICNVDGDLWNNFVKRYNFN